MQEWMTRKEWLACLQRDKIVYSKRIWFCLPTFHIFTDIKSCQYLNWYHSTNCFEYTYFSLSTTFGLEAILILANGWDYICKNRFIYNQKHTKLYDIACKLIYTYIKTCIFLYILYKVGCLEFLRMTKKPSFDKFWCLFGFAEACQAKNFQYSNI